MAAYSLPRGVARDRTRLRTALFDGALEEPETASTPLAVRISELEAKLRAIEHHPGIDHAAYRAAVAHTRLICTPHGYSLSDEETPPPDPGSSVEHDGETYTVWRIGPSPLPGDSRRCAILV